MGNTGLGLVNKPSGSTAFTVFNSYAGSMKWFDNDKMSNAKEWRNSLLTSDEKSAIQSYTGTGYSTMNDLLYNTPWEKMTDTQKKRLIDAYNGLSKFELKKGINVTRQTDFQIFGAGKYDKMSVEQITKTLNNSKGYIQMDGFTSFGANNTGAAIAGSGLVIHLKVPPSKGAGAYVNPISYNQCSGENEFLLNNNAVLHFDTSSIKQTGGKIHIDAEWVGQAKSQTISSTNKSAMKKKK